MSWQKMKGIAHRARTRDGAWAAVRADDDGQLTWELDGRALEVNVPSDFAKAVQPGVEVTIDYARFELTVWRDEAGVVHHRGSRGDVSGAAHRDEEVALWTLLDALGDDAAPRACFFCKWSDVEPSSGWGNLGCFVDRKAEYAEYVTVTGPPTMKWVTVLGCGWVDEWHSCDEFEVRPFGYGYRGRPRPG